MSESRSNPAAILFGGLLVVVLFGSALFYATGQRHWQHEMEDKVSEYNGRFAVLEKRLDDLVDVQAEVAAAEETQDVKIQQIVNAVNSLLAKNGPGPPKAPAVRPEPVEEMSEGVEK